MVINRFLGRIFVILGSLGLVLSLLSDHIGLSITGGSNGWGLVNATGAITASFLLAIGIVFFFRSDSNVTMENIESPTSNNKYEKLYLSSTLPFTTLLPNAQTAGVMNSNGESFLHSEINRNLSQPEIHEESNESFEDVIEYMYECPTCGTEVDDDETKCTICGEELE